MPVEIDWITGKHPDIEDEYIVTIEGATETTSLLWNGYEWLDEVSNAYHVIAWAKFPPVFKGK